VRLAAAGAAIAIMLGSAAAAYAGVLPAPVQNMAHRLIDAPGAHRGGGGSPQSRTGPTAPGATRGPGGSSHAHSLPPGQAKGHRGHAKKAHPAKPAKKAKKVKKVKKAKHGSGQGKAHGPKPKS
jgi:hypothetical protein